MSIKHWHFDEGKSYSITEGTTQGYAISQSLRGLNGSSNPDLRYVFVFVRKEGRHHIFREKTFGWGRTYTDQQLHGKRVEEVQ